MDSTLIEADKAQEMQFKSTFGTIACENLLAVAMKHNEDRPDDHIGKWCTSFIYIYIVGAMTISPLSYLAGMAPLL